MQFLFQRTRTIVTLVNYKCKRFIALISGHVTHIKVAAFQFVRFSVSPVYAPCWSIDDNTVGPTKATADQHFDIGAVKSRPGDLWRCPPVSPEHEPKLNDNNEFQLITTGSSLFINVYVSTLD